MAARGLPVLVGAGVDASLESVGLRAGLCPDLAWVSQKHLGWGWPWGGRAEWEVARTKVVALGVQRRCW